MRKHNDGPLLDLLRFLNTFNLTQRLITWADHDSARDRLEMALNCEGISKGES